MAFRVRSLTPDMQRAIALIKSPDTLTAFDGEKAYRVPAKEVCYIESVDLKTFVYTEGRVFRSKQKLYEVEGLLGDTAFFRASKSMLVNCDKIRTVFPALGGRFTAVMENGEQVIVSRQFVPLMKERFGL